MTTALHNTVHTTHCTAQSDKISRVDCCRYGVFDHQTGQWNGIVKELIDRKADVYFLSEYRLQEG